MNRWLMVRLFWSLAALVLLFAAAPAAQNTVIPTRTALAANTVVLPNPQHTPGVTNPAVTAEIIDRTICVSGWTASVRSPPKYTTSLKRRQLASGYAYRGDTKPGDYEEDHLIPLELGGNPTSESNLWPEPNSAGAAKKDRLENRLHTLVCAGSLSLATAQQAIARNWWAAYQVYVGR